MKHPNITIDMGYRGELDLTILFTDQNGQTHSRTFEFRVFGEKPTVLTVAKARKEPEVIYTTTEREDQ